MGGYPPFADSEDQVAKQNEVEFHSPEWDNVSEVRCVFGSNVMR